MQRVKLERFLLSGIFLVTLICIPSAYGGQPISKSFEFRYFSNNAKADGGTDFKGHTSVFNTEERVEFLRRYGKYAKGFFGCPKLDLQVVTNNELEALMQKLKPQPDPKVRVRKQLNKCKWIAYSFNQHEKEKAKIQDWGKLNGVYVDKGRLVFSDDYELEREIEVQSWRFQLRWRAKVQAGREHGIRLVSAKGGDALSVGVNEQGRIFYDSDGSRTEVRAEAAGKWCGFKLEVDLKNGRYNLYVNGQLKADFVPLVRTGVKRVTKLCVRGDKGVELDDIWGTGYFRTDDVKKPYKPKTFIDEDFAVRPEIEGWNKMDYDDSGWEVGTLPKVHGGERYAGEALYLRRKIEVGEFGRAVLNVEAMEPGGEIWVNGKVVEVVKEPYPVKIEIGEYLNVNKTNLIAVKVNDYKAAVESLGHAPTDSYIGWFAGRMWVDFTEVPYIEDVFVYARDVENPASVQVNFTVQNDDDPFEGRIKVRFYRWYPEESGEVTAREEFAISVNGWQEKEFTRIVRVAEPRLWTVDNPQLYKVEVKLEDDKGEALDDFVVTTGIRTVGQEGGVFRVNGEAAMLNGAQIFGYRPPIENVAKWSRCGPMEWLVKETAMIKKMNGTLMRIHVHQWAHDPPARNINDPRLAEIGDQLGLMFIWATTGWTRSEAWAVDFEGFEHYIKQVRNHPSIVIWEASNHPFHGLYDVEDSNLFVKKVYNSIYPYDNSRLISISSKLATLIYGNDEGTISRGGRRIEPCKEWTADRVTRCNHDHVTGYGREWTELRRFPGRSEMSFLQSKERAYFNTEHQESIGQPNWSLVKGKPWYQVQSYEWKYDEGSIGRRLRVDEWLESQSWQAFSAYEVIRKQRMLGYDGFSWCCLHGGANTATYKKPLIDYAGHAKLAFYANRMSFQNVLAGSDDVDVVYGPGDKIRPILMNLGKAKVVNLVIEVLNLKGAVIDAKRYKGIRLNAGRALERLPSFKPDFPQEGHYAVEYTVKASK